ncbi:Ig-like domain-containing protein [Jatrophihabitans sp.]|uniref:Ig-like domain-containing protein n=1 Tax=Jatrophihabitans sp. TaxID=1932789 RepID=UPI0030C69A10|nr:repeat containing protein [Jatrophihabitans sp.]
MKTRFARAVASATIAGLALVGALVLDSGAASADPPTPPWQVSGNTDANEVGTLSLFDAAGQPVTGGSLSDAPSFAYAVGSAVGRAGDTKATLYGYLPKNGQAPGSWSNLQLSGSSTYPVTGAPASISTTLPVFTGSATNTSIGQLVSAFPNTDDTDDGYAGLYELRVKTSAPGQPANPKYNAVDISVTGQSWQVVYPAPVGASTTVLTASPGSGAAVGTTISLTATVTASSTDGTVQFADGTTSIGAAVPVSGGVATTTWKPATTGTHSLTATFSPAGSAVTPSNGSLTFAVNKATPTLTGTWSTTAPTYGKSYTVAAKVTAPGLSPTGTVSLLAGTTSLGKATLSAGKATITVSGTTLKPGTYTEILSYSGYSQVSATSVTKKVTEAKAKATLAGTWSTTKPTYGKTYTVSATVTAPGTTPTGTVQLVDGKTVLGTGTLSGGKVKITAGATKLVPGNYTETLKYLGSTTVGTASITKAVTEAKATSSTKISLSPTTVTTKKQTKITITVTVTGTTATGTVDLYDSASKLVGTAKLAASNKGKVTVTFPLIKTAGTYSIHVKYLGSTTVSGSTSASVKLTVKKA